MPSAVQRGDTTIDKRYGHACNPTEKIQRWITLRSLYQKGIDKNSIESDALLKRAATSVNVQKETCGKTEE